MGLMLAPNYTRRFYTWTLWKTAQNVRSLCTQYDDDGAVYTIYGYDTPEVHICTIWKGLVPDGVINGGYSQAQNDTDKTDFETNFKSSANSAITLGQTVLITVQGQCATSATTRRQLATQSYVDQTSEAQRSIVSSSVNDTIAGTGIQKVKIVYFTSTWVKTTLELSTNGTTPVNTGNADIQYIEDFYASQVGSGGEAAGNIDLFTTTGGGGTAISRIATAEINALMGHHFVPTGYTCYLTGFKVGNKGGVASRMQFRVFDLSATNKPDSRFDSIPLPSNDSFNTNYQVPQPVIGPVRISIWIHPNQVTATNFHGSFSYYQKVT